MNRSQLKKCSTTKSIQEKLYNWKNKFHANGFNNRWALLAVELSTWRQGRFCSHTLLIIQVVLKLYLVTSELHLSVTSIHPAWLFLDNANGAYCRPTHQIYLFLKHSSTTQVSNTALHNTASWCIGTASSVFSVWLTELNSQTILEHQTVIKLLVKRLKHHNIISLLQGHYNTNMCHSLLRKAQLLLYTLPWTAFTSRTSLTGFYFFLAVTTGPRSLMIKRSSAVGYTYKQCIYSINCNELFSYFISCSCQSEALAEGIINCTILW